jgi:signal transduction histidine kinase
MSLQNKFRFLLIVFGVSVIANMLVSVWCIRVYLDNAAGQFTAHMSSAAQTNEIRSQIDDFLSDLANYADAPGDETRRALKSTCFEIERRIRALTSGPASRSAPRQRELLLSHAAGLQLACEQYMRFVEDGAMESARRVLVEQVEQASATPMRTLLTNLAQAENVAITNTTADMEATQASVTALLSANAVAAFVLAAIGVFLVRNWVLKPVDALKTAAEEHARGNLFHRVPNPSRDELGVLSRTVNRMADSLIEIQKRLVQQERLAALGEVTSTVAHNIRNPLAGIRASAQAAMLDLDPQSDSHRRQMQIVETVDSLNQWVKRLLLVNQPLQLRCRRTPVRELVHGVLRSQQSNAERRNVRFAVGGLDDDCCVHVDAHHIEQALQVVIDNAIDASPEGGMISITADRAAGSDGWMDLRVTDQGPGIPQEVKERIASPYFTTKPGGTGIGLHLAKKAVESHGGDIQFDSGEAGGTTVTLRLPARDLSGGGDGQDPSRR